MIRQRSIAPRLVGLCAALLMSAVSGSIAQAEIVIENGFNFREFRVNLPLSFTQGPDLLILGADILDSDTGERPAGAIAIARNLQTGEVLTLLTSGSVGFFRNIAYSEARAEGNWIIEVNSDVGSAAALLPGFGTGPGTGAIPGVQDLAVVPGPQPVLSWQLPADLPLLNDGNIDRIRLRLEDSNGTRLLDETLDDTSLTTTTATVGPGTITQNGAVVAELLLEGFNPFDRSKTYEVFVVEPQTGGGEEVVGESFFIQDNRQANSTRFQAGPRLTLGVNISPFEDSLVYAENGGAIVPVPQAREADRQFEFATSTIVRPDLRDPWRMVAWNGGMETTLVTHAIGDLELLPFVRDIRMIPDFLTPTFEWSLPAGNTLPFDRIRIGLFDDVTDERLSVFGSAQDELFQNLQPDETSYTFEPGALEEGRKYVVRVILSDRNSDGIEVNRSLSFFNFTPLLTTSDDPLYLPNVDEDGTFSFDFDVVAEAPFDTAVPANTQPPIAVGYEYAAGEGDPNFESVTLPDQGGESYEVVPFDDAGNSLPAETVEAQVEFDFIDRVDPAGVDRFLVLGVEPPELQGQADATVFTTTLTFTDDGQFSGTITPITVSASTTVQLAENLKADLQDLVISGELRRKAGKKLTRIIDFFLVAFARERFDKACRQLDRFVDKVEDLIREGDLSAEAGSPVPLVQQAEAIRGSLAPGACDVVPRDDDDDDDDDDGDDGDDGDDDDDDDD